MNQVESIARAYSVRALGDDTRWESFLEEARFALSAVEYAQAHYEIKDENARPSR